MKIIYHIALFAFLLLETGCGHGKGSREKSIRIAVEFNTHSACAHIATQKGWYKEEGLNIVSYENYITGMALSAALAKGNIDAAYICLIPAVNAYANAGVPIKVISGIHKYGYCLAVNYKRVKRIDDLNRKDIRIGCTREGSPTDAIMQKTIMKYSLDSNGINNRVLRMNPPKLLLYLKMGKLDAAFICEQFPTLAETLGFRVLLSAKDLWPDMQGSVLIARDGFLKSHPDIASRLVKVTQRAVRFINDNPEEASKILAAELEGVGKTILPFRAASVASGLVIAPGSILKSLTLRLENTTDIDQREIQRAIDVCKELQYIKDSFNAEEIIDFRFASSLVDNKGNRQKISD